MRKYLVLGPALSQAQAVARSLQRVEPEGRIIGGLLPGEKPFRSPLYAGFAGVACASDLVAYDQVYFTGSRDFEYFANRELDCRMGPLVQERRNLNFFSKSWSLEFCRQLDIPIPTTWLDYGSIPPDAGPVFYKPAREGGSGIRGRASGAVTIPKAARSSDFIFQELISGPQVVGFCFAAERGAILHSYQHLELASHPPAGGSAVATVTVAIPRIAELAERILQAYRYSGWGLIEFKYDRQRDDYVFMELNPKLWASIELGLRAHAPFARMLLGRSRPEEPIRGVWWPDRVLRNGPAHWWSGLRTARGLARSWEQASIRAFVAGLLSHGLRRLTRRFLKRLLP